jgi:hypothetical protein
MNGKKIIYFLFPLLISPNLYAQITGSPFAPNDTRWSTRNRVCFSITNCPIWWNNFQITGDTVINNKYYQRLDTNTSYYFDTSCLGFVNYFYYENRKLYVDTFLLYDFNLNAGDTFNLYVSSIPLCSHNGYYPMIVDSVDSVYYGSSWRKRITFFQMSGFAFGPIVWVEGIGDINYGFNILDLLRNSV